MDWRHRRSCGDVDPEIFFPVGKKGSTAAAKAICRNCPVQRECLNWALESGQDEGVWGGKDPEERRKFKRQKQHV